MKQWFLRPLLAGALILGAFPSAVPAEDRVLGQVAAPIHEGRPPARFVLEGRSDGALFTIRKVAVFEGDARTPLQVIETGGARTPDVLGAGFVLEDMNFDGYTDFRVQAFVPAGPNTPYLYWLFDPDSGRFQGNKALEEIASPTFHPEEQEIRSENRSSAVAWVRRVYRYVKGTPLLMREEETRVDPEEGIREVTVREIQGGEWAETSRERTSLWTPIPLVSSLNVEQQVTSRHPGWEIRKDTVRHRVTRITVYDGRPEERAALRYSDLKTRNGSRIATWAFEEPVSPQGYWISVHYAATSAVLSRALPAGISALRVVTSGSRLIEGFHEIERVEIR